MTRFVITPEFIQAAFSWFRGTAEKYGFEAAMEQWPRMCPIAQCARAMGIGNIWVTAEKLACTKDMTIFEYPFPPEATIFVTECDKYVAHVDGRDAPMPQSISFDSLVVRVGPLP